jgi:hypothetical protein
MPARRSDIPAGHELYAQREAGGLSNREIGNRYDCDEAVIRRRINTYLRTADIAAPGNGGRSAVNGEVRTLTADEETTVETLMRRHGFDPRANRVKKAFIGTKTTAAGDESPSLRIEVIPRVSAQDILRPFDLTPIKIPKAPPKPKRAARLDLFHGDWQWPYGDKDFDALLLRWVRKHQPDTICDLGDGMDNPTISSHKTKGKKTQPAPVQVCANAYGNQLARFRYAAPDAVMKILADNHLTQRLQDYQLNRAEALYDVHPADIEGLDPDPEALWSVRRLLRLDEMNIEYLDPDEEHYGYSHYEVIPDQLVAIHGYQTGEQAGKNLIDQWDMSVIGGHLHKEDEVVKSKGQMIARRKRDLRYLGVGCGMQTHGGGGFAAGANWHNSALSVSIFPDGQWTSDRLRYDPLSKTLIWRDEIYSIYDED